MLSSMGLVFLALLLGVNEAAPANYNPNGNTNYTEHHNATWDSWGWDQTVVKALPEHNFGHASCPCKAGTECTADTACVDTKIGNECPRRKCPIDIDNCDLPFVYRANEDVDDMVSYATCGHDDSHQAYLELDGATLKVMYVPETPGTYLGSMSGACKGPVENWPTACTGFAYDLLGELQAEGNFQVEIIHDFPDSFWDGVRNFCEKTEGPNWGTEGFTSSGTNLCTLQLWTICAYAASQGYVDYCPNFTFQSDERWAYTDGLVYHNKPYMMASKFVSTDGMHQMFDLLNVWSVTTWIIVVVWVLLSSVAVRSFSGYYGTPVGDMGGYFSRVANDLSEIGWWGAGVFLDVVYPQHIPGKFGKAMMVLFELTQVFLLVSITAGVTAILLSTKAGGITTVEEAIQADGYMCFPFSIYAEDFKLYYPHVPHSKLLSFPNEAEFMAELMKPDSRCSAAISEGDGWAKYKSEGVLCEWVPRTEVWTAADYGPVSPQWIAPLRSLMNRYKSKGIYQQKYDAANAATVGASICDSSSQVSGFKKVSIYYFAGPFIIWAVFFAIGFAHFFIAGPPTGLSASSYNAFTAATSIAPSAKWDFEGFRKDGEIERRASMATSLGSGTVGADLEPISQ